jgi:pimeloyl-ACP methyl ester carboxylesterase
MELVVDTGPDRRDADAPVVVLLHGQPGGAGDWERVVPFLADDHRVLAVHRPGYAGDPSAATTWTGNVVALVALLDRLRVPAATLVGASWGGGVALAAAAGHPARVSGLVLAGSVGAPAAVNWIDRVMAWPPLARPGVAALRHTSPRLTGLLARSSGSRLDSEARLVLDAGLVRLAGVRGWDAALAEQRFLLDDTAELADLLGDVRTPAVVLAGRRDRYVPYRASADLAAALPAAELVSLEAGHLLPLEAPAAIADGVRMLTGVQPKEQPAA